MTNIRTEAFAKTLKRKPVDLKFDTDTPYGSLRFNLHDLKNHLDSATYEGLINLQKGQNGSGDHVSKETADKVANVVREWAVSKGATHYCHWFQPQTGTTAEKHDSFLSFDAAGEPISYLSGKFLMQQEPDASSFPSGGRRTTFEARGYTAWDATSPMFLMGEGRGKTLCIPSVFISYSGESLDTKTPLIKSVEAISTSAVKTLELFNHSSAFVQTTCGPEQEYFLIDKAHFKARPDLQLCGRTLIGLSAAKGQQLEDHYFGSIRPRALSYMADVDHQLHELGVPCKTRHNEVAPSQYEIAVYYENANRAADHNQLLMEILQTTAEKHDLVCLLKEKPYANINGSGKHLNWSLADEKGANLLDPGDQPQDNLRFLYFVTAIVKGIHRWGGLLRASIANSGNDFRLGANEAPPAIMSVFLGSTLTEILDKLGSKDAPNTPASNIDLDLAQVPLIAKEPTDRNRTSPFPFTGNKFEFRALGSSQSISYPVCFLNVAVSWALDLMNADLEKTSRSDADVLKIIKKHYGDAKDVCFDGNGYGEDWVKEAEKRGLPNLKTTPEALKELIKEDTVQLFVEKKTFQSKGEIEARYNVLLDRYIKEKEIECQILSEMVSQYVLPALRKDILESSKLNKIASKWEEKSDGKPSVFDKTLENKLFAYSKLQDLATSFHNEFNKQKESEPDTQATWLSGPLASQMEGIRELCDNIELMVDDGYWTIPRYSEMLYSL